VESHRGETMQQTRRSWIALGQAILFILASGSFAVISSAHAENRQLLVFAAASLRNALDETNAIWARETGRKALISYAASNALVKQIEAGAPADVFLSADLDWMDVAASKNLIRSETRVNLLGNSLVLIAPVDAAIQVSLLPGGNLVSILGKGRLAMGNVNAVPAGKYGRAALERLGLWATLKDKVAQAESVRAALLLVSRGELPLGIVYRTDAAADPSVKIVANFPDGSHPPIVYPAALTATSRHPDAQAFLQFLRLGQAKSLFEKQGFIVMNVQASGS
jgi:molybdate transport system substrate-binding protein